MKMIGRTAMGVLATLMILGLFTAGARGQMMPPTGEPVEHGTKRAGDLEVTLLTAPPLSPEQMQQHMPGMGSMQGKGGMQGMGGMRGTGGMSGDDGTPTHWIGVIVRDVNDGRAVPNADVTLMAKKGDLTRTVKLISMPGSYGANISLLEKGRYDVTVNIARRGQPIRTSFQLDNK